MLAYHHDLVLNFPNLDSPPQLAGFTHGFLEELEGLRRTTEVHTKATVKCGPPDSNTRPTVGKAFKSAIG